MPQAARTVGVEASPAPARDAVTLEIIRGKLLAVADEMGVVVARTSMSPVIYEVLDFACGIVDDQAQVISQTNGITVFTGTFAGHVQSIMRKFAGRMRPGDIYLTNDPYSGGTHLSDVAVIKPVFVDGEVLAFAITVAHWTDIGGKVAGSLPIDATENLHEGIRFTGLRIYREGERSDDLVDLIAANTRLPKHSLGDLNASLAAARIADTRLQEICAKYGAQRARDAFAYMLTTSERSCRAAVMGLPDGVYEAEDAIDVDGTADGQVRVRVQVRIAGDEVTVDFTGSSLPTAGPINCSRGALLSAVKTAFKALVDPHQPGNEGWFKPVKVVVPDGTVFSARHPTPTGWYFEAACHAAELMVKALVPIAPHRYSVGSYLSLCATVVSGTERDTGEPFVLIEPHMGGWGAGQGQDGASALIGIMDGDTYNYSVELLEAKYPVRCVRYALNTQDGAGAGRYRGGFGTVREYEVLAGDGFVYASMGRSIERPWGFAGGGPGSNNYVELKSAAGARRSARLPSTTVKPAEVFSIVTGGGGGYGDPLTRPEADVLADVLDGYISAERARTDYGVVIRADHSLDRDATRALRQAR